MQRLKCRLHHPAIMCALGAIWTDLNPRRGELWVCHGVPCLLVISASWGLFLVMIATIHNAVMTLTPVSNVVLLLWPAHFSELVHYQWFHAAPRPLARDPTPGWCEILSWRLFSRVFFLNFRLDFYTSILNFDRGILLHDRTSGQKRSHYSDQLYRPAQAVVAFVLNKTRRR